MLLGPGALPPYAGYDPGAGPAGRKPYERELSPGEQTEVEATRLSDIIRRNTGIGAEIQDDVFLAP